MKTIKEIIEQRGLRKQQALLQDLHPRSKEIVQAYGYLEKKYKEDSGTKRTTIKVNEINDYKGKRK